MDQSRTLKSLSTPTHHHHPPTKTFKRVLCIVGGQDLVCRLHITQATRSRNFYPHSKKKFSDPKVCWTLIYFGPKIFWTFFYPKGQGYCNQSQKLTQTSLRFEVFSLVRLLTLAL